MTEEDGERILRQLVQKMADDAMGLLCGSGALQSPRPTALRLTPSGRLEVVELDADGRIIEPPKRCQRCGPVFLCSEHMGN